MRKQNNGSDKGLAEEQKQKLKQYAEELKQIQFEIENNDSLSTNHGKIALNFALKAGGLLREAKKLVPHGQWEKWLTEHVKLTIRTAQNYMKLASEAAVVAERQQENPKAKIISFLGEAQSLREAYMAAGIIRPSGAKKQHGGNKPPTPEELKSLDGDAYAERIKRARMLMVERVRREIDGSVEWSLSEWTVKNDKPCSGDNENRWAQLLGRLREWVSFRNHGELKYEDEVFYKTEVVLCELVKTIISANCPKVVERKTLEVVSPCFQEQKTEPAETIQTTTE